jgi:hypothetical protein
MKGLLLDNFALLELLGIISQNCQMSSFPKVFTIELSVFLFW